MKSKFVGPVYEVEPRHTCQRSRIGEFIEVRLL